jgi:hypothetical protein
VSEADEHGDEWLGITGVPELSVCGGSTLLETPLQMDENSRTAMSVVRRENAPHYDSAFVVRYSTLRSTELRVLGTVLSSCVYSRDGFPNEHKRKLPNALLYYRL